MEGYRTVVTMLPLLCGLIFGSHVAEGSSTVASANLPSACGECCWTSADMSGTPCCEPNRLAGWRTPHGWLDVDYLMWWTRGASLPPLITSSSRIVPRPDAGVLGRPTTQVLFGDERVGDRLRSGVRVGGGIWLDPCQDGGLDFDFFALETQSGFFRAASDGDPILARPYTDATTLRPEAELIAYPDLIGGQVDVSATSSGIWGAGLAWRGCLSCCRNGCNGFRARTDWMVGYRHLHMDDRLTITEQLASPLFLAGTDFTIEDRFATRNSFHGLELGLMRSEQLRAWTLDYFAKVALGWNASSMRIRGQTTLDSPGFSTIVQEGGLLALESNSGRYDNNDFGAVFQFGTHLMYRVSDQLGFRIGYTLLLWPEVYRAGDQIDTVVNPNLLPPAVVPLTGPRRPLARLHESSFWAQGLQLGLEFRF